MKSKFELSISTNYVPEWGIVEAFRELFQNALDNETVNPDNKMGFEYKDDTVRISNKTSKLEAESLLLGSSTKSDDDRTIGQHGEGYKIAFMVLLRNNKKIKVYNYGAKEIWEVRLVNSKRYNGQQIPTVFIEKEAVWKTVPSDDLIIEVSGITNEEYKQVVKSNLHLRNEEVKRFSVEEHGAVLLDDKERGRIYVKGLFVNSTNNLEYGYDFEPTVVKLDRDRKLIDSFDISWEASIIWLLASDSDDEMRKIATELVNKNAADTQYVKSNLYKSNLKTLINNVAKEFYNEHGENAVPVTNNAEYKEIERSEQGEPVIVEKNIAEMIRSSDVAEEHSSVTIKTLKEKFTEFMDSIESKLTDEELETLKELIDEIDK